MKNKLLLLKCVILCTLAANVLQARDLRTRAIPNVIKTANKKYHSQNGTDVIDINKANNNGVSHNKFEDFSVGENNNVIFNNSATAGTSILGGKVDANTNLTKNTTASVILNEINGGNPSSINGGVEIFGRRADIIFANENGINVNGGKFYNTSGVTLTTGKVTEYTKNKTISVDVKKGNINIGKDGVEVVNSGNLNILAQNINIDGKVDGKGNVNIIAGENEINFRNNSLSNPRVSNSSNTAPSVLTGTQLGSMYGNNITLINTGGGITNNANIHASNSISISSNGDLILSKTSNLNSQNGISINSNKNIINEGNIKSNNGGISLLAEESLKNEGKIKGYSIDLTGNKNLVNTATLTSEGATTLRGDVIENTGDITAQYGNVSFKGVNSVKNNGNINGYGLSVSAKDIVNNGKIDVNGSINFTGDNIENNNTIASTGANYYEKVEFNATNSIKNNATIDGRNIILNAQNNIDNSGKITANGYVDLVAKDIINTADIKSNNGGISLLAEESLKNEGKIKGYSIDLTGNKNLVNTATLTSEGATTLRGDVIENTGDITAQYGNVSFKGVNSVKNNGNINGYGLSVSAKDIVNNGKIDVNGSINFTGDNIENNNTIASTGANYYEKVEFNATNSIKNNATIDGRSIILNAQNNIDSSGKITANGYVDLVAKNIINTADIKSNNGGISLLAKESLKNEGKIEGYSIDLTGNKNLVNTATLTSEGATTLRGDVIENTGDITAQYGNVSFKGVNSVKNNGNINGYGLSVSAKDIVNNGKIDVNGSINFTGDNIENNNTITSTGTNYYEKVEFNATNSIKNTAEIKTNSSVGLSAKNINNSGSVTGRVIELNGTNITSEGQLNPTDTLIINGKYTYY